MKLINICLAISLFNNIHASFVVTTKFTKNTDKSFVLQELVITSCEQNTSGGSDNCNTVSEERKLENFAGTHYVESGARRVIFGNTLHWFKGILSDTIFEFKGKKIALRYTDNNECPIMSNLKNTKEITCMIDESTVTNAYTTPPISPSMNYIPLLLLMNNKDKFRICEFNMYDFLKSAQIDFTSRKKNLEQILRMVNRNESGTCVPMHDFSEEKCEQIKNNVSEVENLLGANTDSAARNRFIKFTYDKMVELCTEQDDSSTSHFINYSGTLLYNEGTLIV